MKRSAYSTITVLMAVLFIVSPARGEDKSNYIAVKGGIFSPSSDLDDADFDTGFAGEAVIGGYYNEYLAAEIGVGYFELQF